MIKIEIEKDQVGALYSTLTQRLAMLEGYRAETEARGLADAVRAIQDDIVALVAIRDQLQGH